MRFAVRSLAVSFFAVLFFFTFLKPALAQSSLDTSLPSATQPSFNNSNLHVYVQNVFIEISSTIVCQLIGRDFTANSKGCLGLDFKTGKIGYVQNQGLVPFMEQMITVLYIPPTHTSDYFVNLAASFGITKPAMAQAYANGVGFQSLTPFESIWIAFRNLAYLIFIVAFLIVGLGIMLRIRIDPRTVMTIQNMLPKIVMGLILITFSFAIAGFLIDVMWVAIILVINILGNIPIVDPNSNPQTTHTILRSISPDSYSNPFSFVNVLGGIIGIATTAGVQVGALINHSMNPGAMSTVIPLPTPPVSNSGGCGFLDFGCYVGAVLSVVGGIFSATIGGLINTVIGMLVGIIVGAIASLVIIIAIIWALFKIWFALIKAYIFTLADIIFAPFWILGGLIPGSSIGFGAWLRDMLSNLAAFPVVIVMFLLAKILMDAVASTPSLYMPPLLSGVSGSFGAIIALGILLSAPGVLDITKAMFKAPRINLGPVEKAVGTGAVVLGAGGKRAWGSMYYKDKEGNLRGIAGFAQRQYLEKIPAAVGTKTQSAAKTVSGAVGSTANWAANTPVGKVVTPVVAPPAKTVAKGVKATTNMVTYVPRKVAGGVQKFFSEKELYETNLEKARSEKMVEQIAEGVKKAGFQPPAGGINTPPANNPPGKNP